MSKAQTQQAKPRDRAQELVDALHGTIEEMKAEAEAATKAAAEAYFSKKRAMENAEAPLAAAQQRVQELEAGRGQNASALQVALLDDDQAALKAVQAAEKARKKDLAKAQKDLDKASEASGKVRVNLPAEAAAASFVAIKAQGQINNTVNLMLQALELALDRQKHTSVVVDDHGTLAEANRLQLRGRIHDADLEAAQRVQDRVAKEFSVVL